MNEQQPGFVYGLDKQTYDKEFAILVEGPMDAIHIDGCALGGSEINDAQALLLDRLGKRDCCCTRQRPRRQEACRGCYRQRLGS